MQGPRLRARLKDALLLTAALAAVLAVCVLPASVERRAIERLPAETRGQIFSRAMANFMAMCQPSPPGDLRERCRADAQFLLAFPECHGDCSALLEKALRQIRR